MARRAQGMPDSVRRRLLRLGGYVPPAILGVVAAPAVAEAALAMKKTKKCCGTVIVISAGGNACCPCVVTCPNGMPNPKYNPIKCAQKRCELDCRYCSNVCWPSLKKCRKEPGEKIGGCPCTCVRLGPGCWVCR